MPSSQTAAPPTPLKDKKGMPIAPASKEDFKDILAHFESVQERHTRARQISLQSRSLMNNSDKADEVVGGGSAEKSSPTK
jgi:hypothetical protein